jgi:ABC-2 type transport system ATP-binding protein
MQIQPIITTSNLTKKYKDTIALDTLNLSINKGEIFGFLGHNGSSSS